MANTKIRAKPNIVSMRLSDDEMESIRQFMELTNIKRVGADAGCVSPCSRTRVGELRDEASAESEGSRCS